MHVAEEPSGVATQRSPSSPAPAGPRGADADAVTARSAIGAVAPRHLTVDGVVLAFDDEGSGPPVVCLHAIGHGARDFERLRARLRDRHRVIALDWPGQGRSGGDHRPASAGRYAELLDAFLTAAGIERPILVGNSIGGAVAIRYAHARPAAVRALVLENPGGLATTTDLAARLALAAMARFFGAGARGARWFPAAFALYYRSVLQRPAARAQRRRIVAAAYDLAPVLAQAWSSFAAPEADLRAVAPAVTCPVLFAWAARDQVVSLRRSLPAIRQFPNARIERFPAGHAPHLETPDALEASIERFLAPLCR